MNCQHFLLIYFSNPASAQRIRIRIESSYFFLIFGLGASLKMRALAGLSNQKCVGAAVWTKGFFLTQSQLRAD
jgi:hypothetical protein